MKYQIVQSVDANVLASMVEDLLADGWVVVGGVSITLVSYSVGLYTIQYAQAMMLPV